MILVDTNVLARAIQRGHVHQQAALDALAFQRKQRHEILVVSPQVVMEFYATCTRTGNGLGMTAEEALAEVVRIKHEYPIFPETPTLFPEWEYLVVKYKPTNRRIFDARLVALMLVHRIPEILSFNDKDFAPYREIRAVNPFDLLGIPRR